MKKTGRQFMSADIELRFGLKLSVDRAALKSAIRDPQFSGSRRSRPTKLFERGNRLSFYLFSTLFLPVTPPDDEVCYPPFVVFVKSDLRVPAFNEELRF